MAPTGKPPVAVARLALLGDGRGVPVGFGFGHVALKRNIDDSSCARVDAARKRAGIVVPDATGAGFAR